MKSVCVYCGSSPGRLKAYADAARSLARALVDRGLSLVYGGASIGIMGLIADTVLDHGGDAVGVIPEALLRKEVAHGGLSELHVTRSMHERKTRMAELSDGFVAMPGGIGTFEEIFEVWSWARLGFHQKPCGLLNVGGYYDTLAGFLDHAVAERFIQKRFRAMLMVEREAEPLLERFLLYRPPDVEKWVGKGQT